MASQMIMNRHERARQTPQESVVTALSELQSGYHDGMVSGMEMAITILTESMGQRGLEPINILATSLVKYRGGPKVL